MTRARALAFLPDRLPSPRSRYPKQLRSPRKSKDFARSEVRDPPSGETKSKDFARSEVRDPPSGETKSKDFARSEVLRDSPSGEKGACGTGNPEGATKSTIGLAIRQRWKCRAGR